MSTANNLPSYFSPPVYRVLKTMRLSPRPRVAIALVPLNVILVEFLGLPQGPLDLSEQVCAGFDITLCAASLQVLPDYTYLFYGHGEAFTHLRNRQLALSRHAFGAQPSSIDIQMSRIAKYAARGFRWQPFPLNDA